MRRRRLGVSNGGVQCGGRRRAQRGGRGRRRARAGPGARRRGGARPERARQQRRGLFSRASSTRFPRPSACLRTSCASTDSARRLIAALLWLVSRGRLPHWGRRCAPGPGPWRRLLRELHAARLRALVQTCVGRCLSQQGVKCDKQRCKTRLFALCTWRSSRPLAACAVSVHKCLSSAEYAVPSARPA